MLHLQIHFSKLIISPWVSLLSIFWWDAFSISQIYGSWARSITISAVNSPESLFISTNKLICHTISLESIIHIWSCCLYHTRYDIMIFVRRPPSLSTNFSWTQSPYLGHLSPELSCSSWDYYLDLHYLICEIVPLSEEVYILDGEMYPPPLYHILTWRHGIWVCLHHHGTITPLNCSLPDTQLEIMINHFKYSRTSP